MNKESMMKLENFAKKIIELAAEEKLTVSELHSAVNIAKGISDNSTVEVESIKKADYPLRYIWTCDGKELFEIAQKTGSSGVNCYAGSTKC